MALCREVTGQCSTLTLFNHMSDSCIQSAIHFLSTFSILTLWRQFKKCTGHSWAHGKQVKIVDPIELTHIIFEYVNDGLLVRNHCSKKRPPIGQRTKTTRLMA